MDISLYTDGEQATAAVLNRPLNEIKSAIDPLETSVSRLEKGGINSTDREYGKSRIKEYSFNAYTYSWDHDGDPNSANRYSPRPIRICKMKPSYGRCEIELTLAADSNYSNKFVTARLSISAYAYVSNGIAGRKVAGGYNMTIWIDSLGYLWVWTPGLWDSRCTIKMWRDIHIVDWEFAHHDEIIYKKTGGGTSWYMKDASGEEVEMNTPENYELGFPRGLLCDSTKNWGMIVVDEDTGDEVISYSMRDTITMDEEIYLRFYQSVLDNEDGSQTDHETIRIGYIDKIEEED